MVIVSRKPKKEHCCFSPHLNMKLQLCDTMSILAKGRNDHKRRLTVQSSGDSLQFMHSASTKLQMGGEVGVMGVSGFEYEGE
jgi:hypothetical protein